MGKEEKKDTYEVRQRIIQAEPVIHNIETDESIEIAEGIAKILNELKEIKEQIK